MPDTWRLSRALVTLTRVCLTFKRWISGKPSTLMGLAVKDGLVNLFLAGLIRMVTLSRQWTLGCRRLRLLLRSALLYQLCQVSIRIAFTLILPIQIMATRVC